MKPCLPDSFWRTVCCAFQNHHFVWERNWQLAHGLKCAYQQPVQQKTLESRRFKDFPQKCLLCCCCTLPSHVTPSPEYPSKHAQVKLPIVFVHSAFTSQLSVPSIHSSISENTRIEIKTRIRNTLKTGWQENVERKFQNRSQFLLCQIQNLSPFFSQESVSTYVTPNMAKHAK